jgi:hypothetical protein
MNVEDPLYDDMDCDKNHPNAFDCIYAISLVVPGEKGPYIGNML